MRWIGNIVREVFGLFVDDGSFAIAILAWIGIVGFALSRTAVALPGGLILFIGLCLVLLESVTRFSRRAVKGTVRSKSQ